MLVVVKNSAFERRDTLRERSKCLCRVCTTSRAVAAESRHRLPRNIRPSVPPPLAPDIICVCSAGSSGQWFVRTQARHGCMTNEIQGKPCR